MKNYLLLLPGLFFCFFTFSQHSNAALGIQSNRISEERAEEMSVENPYGSIIRKVYPNSAAEKLGLQEFDYIYRIEETELSKKVALSQVLNQYQPEDQVEVFFVRNGQKKSGKVALININDIQNVRLKASEDPFLGIEPRHNQLPEDLNGVAVGIVHNSTAEAMGLEDGDIIMAIDQYSIFNWHDISPAIDARKVGDEIAITVYRDGEVFTRKRSIKSRAATHNDHSRPEGPQIIKGQEEDTIIAVALLTQPTEEEEKIFPDEKKEAITADTNTNVLQPSESLVIQELKYNKLNIFPNPSTGIFDIEFNLPELGDTYVRIYSSNGQPVYFNTLGQFTGTFSDRIDIANNVKGFYFLEVRQDEKVLTKKLVLQ